MKQQPFLRFRSYYILIAVLIIVLVSVSVILYSSLADGETSETKPTVTVSEAKNATDMATDVSPISLSPTPVHTGISATATLASPSILATPFPFFPRQIDESEVERILSNLTLEQKIGQMIMIGMPEATIDNLTQSRIANQNIGGIILLDRNLSNPEQTRNLTNQLQQTAMQNGVGIPLFVGWNQEGGEITRPDAGVTIFPSNMALGVIGKPEVAYTVGRMVGEEMLDLGVNMNYAPVLDVNTNPANPIIGLRSYGETSEIVSRMGMQYIGGQQATGVIAVAKHFPGHGSVAIDSHVDLPRLDITKDNILQTELPPFQDAVNADVGGVMVAHVVVPDLDDSGLPASLSHSIVTDLLRVEMGFDGVIMSDDMGMGAIRNNYDLSAAVVQSVQAGVDLFLTVESQSYPDIIIQALVAAVNDGRISLDQIEESVGRLLRLKLAYGLYDPSRPLLTPELKAVHLQYALDIGAGAVVKNQDEYDWLPLSLPTNQLMLISPFDINPGSLQGDGKSLLNELLAKRGIVTTELFYNHKYPYTISQAQADAVALASTVDAFVVITWDAHLRYAQAGETGQETLVNSLLSLGKPVIVVFGSLPYDQMRIPNAPTQITLYGDTDGQIAGLETLLSEE